MGDREWPFHELETKYANLVALPLGLLILCSPVMHLPHPPRNPSLPTPMVPDETNNPGGVTGCGWRRKYIHPQELRDHVHALRAGIDPATPDLADALNGYHDGYDYIYPPRPVPGSIADLDLVTERCDFSGDQYVRDCLEYLRVGAGLDNLMPHTRPPRVGGTEDELPGTAPRKVDYRLGRYQLKPPAFPTDWRYVYMEDRTSIRGPSSNWSRAYIGGRGQEPPLSLPPPRQLAEGIPSIVVGSGTTKADGPEHLAPTHKPLEPPLHAGACNEEYPRVFHMFWTGEFTDKPYITLLSYLYTQNLGLDKPQNAKFDANFCRPQFWVWINPQPKEGKTRNDQGDQDDTIKEIFDSLARNPWGSPFLHPRFKDVIKFKYWNTTEQLDATPEWANEWRNLLGNGIRSDGKLIAHKRSRSGLWGWMLKEGANAKTVEGDVVLGGVGENHEREKEEDEQFERGELKSSSAGYDTKSVVLSDTARWLLLHRYGGVYLDADALLLRDWEELWGYRGAFAYRWSRLPDYNTAILKVNKGSALGTFLLRTALRNGMDLHPMTIWRYVKDAGLEWLLYRLPDALFDPAWLNTEKYQRDRPPTPYFTLWVPLSLH
jgi:WD repeat and SOF domain-containing protein 1